MAISAAVLGCWLVLALPFAKILATSLSIGSGGSGGIFGPGMVIGAFLGAALWKFGPQINFAGATALAFTGVGAKSDLIRIRALEHEHSHQSPAHHRHFEGH